MYKRQHLTSAYNEKDVLLAKLESWLPRQLPPINELADLYKEPAEVERKEIHWDLISINQPWQNKNKVPDQVLKSALARGINISVEKWRNLNELDRFAFCKLVRPSHEHNNLDRAFDEILK